MSTSQDLGQSSEDYLKAIYTLGQETAGVVNTNQLAQALGVSAAAATKAIQHLADKELIIYKPYYGASLTELGQRAAVRMVRLHRLLELFLHDVLGYSWDEVDVEAERLEHHVSALMESRIDAYLNYPTIDPHGDPIPSSDGVVIPRKGKALAECEMNDKVEVLRVSDRSSEVLQYLDTLELRPGVELQVVDKKPFDGPLTVTVGGESHVLGRNVAGYVFVKELVTTI